MSGRRKTMNWRPIGVVFRKELTDSLRDRRTVLSMIVWPIILMPVLMLAAGVLSARLIGQAMQETPTVMVLGGEDSPRVMEALRQVTGVRIVPTKPDYADEILDRRLRAAVEIPEGFDATVARGETATVRIYEYAGELRSGFGASRLQQFFNDYRQNTIRERLQAARLPASFAEPLRVEEKNVAPPERAGGMIMGGLVPYFVILLSLIGAMYPAMDLTVGEKERGTIETILCSPLSRTQLVLGKFLLVLVVAISATALSMLSLGMTAALGKTLLARFAPASGVALQLSIGPKALAWVFLMIVPLDILFSAALLAIALFAKTFKEAQSYISPLTIFVVIPAIISLLPGVELNLPLSLVPILNTSLITKDIVIGNYHWNYIAWIFVSSCVYAAIALRVAIRLFQREDVLFRT